LCQPHLKKTNHSQPPNAGAFQALTKMYDDSLSQGGEVMELKTCQGCEKAFFGDRGVVLCPICTVVEKSHLARRRREVEDGLCEEESSLCAGVAAHY
jgi:uncharacterized Zn finger protein (UPF0148 family)